MGLLVRRTRVTHSGQWRYGLEVATPLEEGIQLVKPFVTSSSSVPGPSQAFLAYIRCLYCVLNRASLALHVVLFLPSFAYWTLCVLHV